MTKEEQIRENSWQIAQRVSDLRNYFHAMQKLVDPEADTVRKERAIKGLEKALDYIAKYNMENRNLTSK